MNLLYLAGRFPKVSETFVYNEVLANVERGCDVRVVGLRPPEAMGLADEASVRALADTAPAVPLGWRGWPSTEELAVPEERLSRRVYAGLAARWIRERVLDGFRPDVIHAHFMNLPALVAGTLSVLLDVPYTFTAHSDDYRLKMSPDLLRRRLLHADGAFVVSDFAREEIKQRGRLTNEEMGHVCVVRAAMRPRVAPRRDRSAGPFRLVSVARLVPTKGIDTALRALAMVTEHEPDARYDIVGDGPDRDMLERLARELKLAGAVTFHGARDNAATQALVAAADVCVLPSAPARGVQRDGIPVTLMEAGALGVPVISTGLSGIPELVEHREGGLLVSPEAEGELAEAILELAGDPERRRRYGSRLQQRVGEEFTLDLQIDRLHRAWKRLLDTDGRSGRA